MTFEPKTIKVELDGGSGFGPFKKTQAVILYQDLRHGTQRTVNALTRPFLNYGDGGPKLVVEEEGGTPKVKGVGVVDVDLGKIDFDAVNDAIIIGQVKEWPFGPVDQETLDGIPEEVRGVLVAKCNELYGATGPLAQGGVGK